MRSGVRVWSVVAGLALVLAVSPAGYAESQPASTKEQREQEQAFREFRERVDAYLRLRKQVEADLPGLKPTDQPEKIKEHRLLFAQKMMAARKDAKRGDIFTEEAGEQFRELIRNTFKGPQGRELRKTLHDVQPAKLRLYVNTTYPEEQPVTTMPPTLLAELPKLPPEVEYRVVGRYLVLQDSELRLVIDFIREAYPKPLR